MSFWGKQHWDKIISNSSLTNSLHGGSVPNLLSPPRSESSRTRVSMDFLRDWASDLGSLNTGLNLSLSSTKWPSLVTVCKWKQSLTEKLKKRASAEEPQVRKHGHLEQLEALESFKKIIQAVCISSCYRLVTSEQSVLMCSGLDKQPSRQMFVVLFQPH